MRKITSVSVGEQLDSFITRMAAVWSLWFGQ